MGVVVVGATLSALAFGADGASAHARMPQHELTEAARAYDIPASSVASALNRLADESGAQIVYDSRLTRAMRTPGLSGRHTLAQALARLLSGTGLDYEVAADGRSATILLAQAGGTRNDAGGAQALPPIDVGAAQPRQEAAQGGGTQAPAGLRSATGPAVQNTTAGPVRGYQALTARAARLDTPIQQLPMSVQVIPRKVIDDQAAISQSEVFRNVSGLQPLDPMFPGGLGVKLRGMQAERYVDGLPNYYDFGVRDLLVNVERVEVLKGPASILFQGGQSPVGGVVNIVSKLPTPDRFAEAGVRAGGYRYGSPYIDVNQPLNDSKTALFRLTAQYETTHSVVDVVHRRSYTIHPTLKFTNNDTTSLIVQGYLSRREQPDYPGLPAVGAIDRSFYTVRRTAFLANPALPKTGTESSGVTLRFDHKFNETFSTFTSARFSSSRLYEPSQTTLGNQPTDMDFGFFGVYGGPSKFYVLNTLMSQQLSEFSVTSNVVAKFDAGPTQNRLLVGGDFNRVWERGLMTGGNATGPDPVFGFFGFPALIDFRFPVIPPYATPLEGLPGAFLFSKINNTYQNAGATVQLQSTIFERLHFLGALRVAMVDIHSLEQATFPQREFNTSETKVLPRVGATFDVTDWLAVYGSYSEGLRAVNFFNGPGGVAPKPEGSQQWEAGVKIDGLYGLSGTLAYFDLTRTNVPTTPPGGLAQRQTGAQHSDGFEADLVWQPTPNLSFLGSYAHINARVSRDEDIRLVNSWLTGVPRDSGRLWGNYAFDGALKGWSFGAGFYAASGQQIELARPWFTNGYITFDANLAYRHDNFTFAITAKNLADRHYFIQYPYLQGRVAPGDGRTLFASFSVRM